MKGQTRIEKLHRAVGKAYDEMQDRPTRRRVLRVKRADEAHWKAVTFAYRGKLSLVRQMKMARMRAMWRAVMADDYTCQAFQELCRDVYRGKP